MRDLLLQIPGISPVLLLSFGLGIASFLHCSVMCGPLLLIFRERGILYHLGRVVGYTSVGALVGYAGQSVDRAASLVEIQNASLYLSGAILILYAFFYLLPPDLFQRKGGSGISWYHKPALLIAKLKRGATALPPTLAAVAAGTLSALLPCGVLYPVWALAAGSGTPLFGAEVGFSFVLGTIPALLGVQFASGRVGRMKMLSGRRVKIVTASILLLSGVALMTFRGNFMTGLDFSDRARGDGGECLPGHSLPLH